MLGSFLEPSHLDIMGGHLLDLMNKKNLNINGAGEDLQMKKRNFVCIFEFTQNCLQTSYSLQKFTIF
jgi:hypothetical protein